MGFGAMNEVWQQSSNMFEHVKHVDGWMTLIYYVYDSIYCKVMTIVVCNI
jgi:uncharacterized membrane protein